MLERYLKLHRQVVVLYADGSLGKKDEDPVLPDDDMVQRIRDYVKLLKMCEQVSRVLEGEKYTTLAHAPALVKSMVENLKEDKMPLNTAVGVLARDNLRKEIEGRFSYLYTEVNEALLAAAVHPSWGHLSFISLELRDQVWKKVLDWLCVLQAPAGRGADEGEGDTSSGTSSSPLPSESSDSDSPLPPPVPGDESSGEDIESIYSPPDPISRDAARARRAEIRQKHFREEMEERLQALRGKYVLFTHLHCQFSMANFKHSLSCPPTAWRRFESCKHRKKYKLRAEDLLTESVPMRHDEANKENEKKKKARVAAWKKFYMVPEDSSRSVSRHFVDIHPTVKMLLSLPASSAPSERVFSCSGYLKPPSRSSLSPTSLEKMTVIRTFLHSPLFSFDKLLDSFCNVCNLIKFENEDIFDNI